MARKDLPPEERDRQPLQLTQLVDCRFCAVTFDVVFVAPPGVFDLEDLDDAPDCEAICPACGAKGEYVYEGWLHHNDAG